MKGKIFVFANLSQPFSQLFKMRTRAFCFLAFTTIEASKIRLSIFTRKRNNDLFYCMSVLEFASSSVNSKECE